MANRYRSHSKLVASLLAVFFAGPPPPTSQGTAGSTRGPFPPLTNFTMSAPGAPAFAFDGVDYEQLPRRLRQEYVDDCYEEQSQCLRYRHIIAPVCGFNFNEERIIRFMNLCELNVQNCYLMVRSGRGVHGSNLRDRQLFYLGDGDNCDYIKNSRRNIELIKRIRSTDEQARKNHLARRIRQEV